VTNKLCPYRKQCDQYDGGRTCIMKIDCGLRDNFKQDDEELEWPEEE